MLIDTHAHLDMDEYKDDLRGDLLRAGAAGVAYVVTIGTDAESNEAAARLADSYDNVYFSAGFHPHNVKDITEPDYAALARLLSHPKAAALGEFGLDYHYDHSPRPLQREHFARQLRVAREMGKPVIIHSREAEEDTVSILRTEGLPKEGGVMHCFAGGRAMADAALGMGLYIAVGGTLTYKNAEALRGVIREVPIERIVLETDCPYLSPVPMRGKRNEPAYVRYVAERLAELKGLSVEDVGRITSLNASTLFGMGARPETGSIAYAIRDSLYLNVTNRCTNACTFCIRNTSDFVKGHNLRLTREPSVDEVLAAMDDAGFGGYREVVLCGYGEPLLRLELVKQVAQWLKERKAWVRLNTNGQGSLIAGRNVVPELKGLIDEVSISLNAADDQTYQGICHSRYGDAAFSGIKQFTAECARAGIKTSVTVLEMPGISVAACGDLARELGAVLRVRHYDAVG